MWLWWLQFFVLRMTELLLAPIVLFFTSEVTRALKLGGCSVNYVCPALHVVGATAAALLAVFGVLSASRFVCTHVGLRRVWRTCWPAADVAAPTPKETNKARKRRQVHDLRLACAKCFPADATLPNGSLKARRKKRALALAAPPLGAAATAPVSGFDHLLFPVVLGVATVDVLFSLASCIVVLAAPSEMAEVLERLEVARFIVLAVAIGACLAVAVGGLAAWGMLAVFKLAPFQHAVGAAHLVLSQYMPSLLYGLARAPLFVVRGPLDVAFAVYVRLCWCVRACAQLYGLASAMAAAHITRIIALVRQVCNALRSIALLPSLVCLPCITTDLCVLSV